MNHDDVLRFDQAAFALAQARMKSMPIELTESDLDQLAIVSPRLEADAREARKQAQLALVRPTPALVTKSVTPTAKRRALTTQDYPEIADAIVAGIKRALEQPKAEIESLKNRILELEAQAAARTVEQHADR